MPALAEALVAGVVLVVAPVASTASADGSVPPERQSDLLHLLKHDCGSCHGLTMKGGLGPPLLPDTLAGRADADLAEIILEGVPGTPMPPWRSQLRAGEADWLVRQLKQGLPTEGMAP
ncbi:MAG: cytochrome c [Rhodospirillales bacterium]|nr:cytochrome c [Rhodospirillales bacterium]